MFSALTDFFNTTQGYRVKRFLKSLFLNTEWSNKYCSEIEMMMLPDFCYSRLICYYYCCYYYEYYYDYYYHSLYHDMNFFFILYFFHKWIVLYLDICNNK